MRAKLTITLLIVLMVLVAALFGVLIFREQADRTPGCDLAAYQYPDHYPGPDQDTNSHLHPERGQHGISGHAHTGSPYPGAYPNRYGGAGAGCFGRSCAGAFRP